MALSDICDELDLNLPQCSPRIFRTDRFDYIQSILGEDITQRYSMQTIKAACDGMRFCTPRQLKELRHLAKELAESGSCSLSKLGRTTKFCG